MPVSIQEKSFLKARQADFFHEIEELVWMSDLTYMDAIIVWSEQNNFDVEYAAHMAKQNPTMMSKLQSEAENLHFIKKPQSQVATPVGYKIASFCRSLSNRFRRALRSRRDKRS